MADLKKALGPIQFFTIGFGGIVGTGWIVYLGLWYRQAGPVGTTIAFLVGGALMALVGLCYAEVGSMFPVAGGEAVYAFAAIGRRSAMVVGWAMVLMMTAVVPYVSISLAWILDVLIPGIGGPVLYQWRGQPIRALALAITIGWAIWLGLLNYLGVKGAAKFQDWLTFGKVAISLLFFGAGIFAGSTRNLEPIFPVGPSGSVWGGLIAVLATTPWFFGGFNGIPQVFEERSPSAAPRTLGVVVVLSILAAAVYYGLAAFTAGLVGPWQKVVEQDLPAAAAFRLAFGSELLARVVLVVGLLGVVTVGNAASLASTRLLFALGRARMIPTAFTTLHPRYGSPVTAIWWVTLFAVLASFLGKSGIAPIVSVGSTAGSLAYLVTSFGVIRLRRLDPHRPRPYRVPAGLAVAALATVGSGFLLVSSLRQHWVDAGETFPLEWAVIAVWTLIGVALWRAAARARASFSSTEERRAILGEG